MALPTFVVQIGWNSAVQGTIVIDYTQFLTPATFAVTNKQLTSNVATLTCAGHTLNVGDTIYVAGVDATFNGVTAANAAAGTAPYVVTATSATTVSYALTAANVASTAVTGGTVGLVRTTDVFANAFTAFYNGPFDDVTLDCQRVSVKRGRDDLVNQMNAGTCDLEFMRPTSRSYWNPANPTSPLNANNSPGFVPMRPLRVTALTGAVTNTITNKQLAAGVATVTTQSAHGITAGQQILVTNIDANFNGTYTVSSVTTTTVTYLVTSSVTVASTAVTYDDTVAPATLYGPITGTYGIYAGYLRSAKFDYQSGMCQVSCIDLMSFLNKAQPIDPDSFGAVTTTFTGDAGVQGNVQTTSSVAATGTGKSAYALLRTQ